jgi:hypothetical protein
MKLSRKYLHIFSYRQWVWQLISTFFISLTTAYQFCSTQTQFLLQMDLPLHIHTRSCKKSNVMGPSKYFGIKYLFSFLHPYSKGDLDGGLASLACIFTWFFLHYKGNLFASPKYLKCVDIAFLSFLQQM